MPQRNISDFKLCKMPDKEYLGEGSFGKVYLAQLRETGQFYAIKAIRKSLMIDSNFTKMAQLESEIMESNEHPNLIKLQFCF